MLETYLQLCGIIELIKLSRSTNKAHSDLSMTSKTKVIKRDSWLFDTGTIFFYDSDEKKILNIIKLIGDR